MEEEMEEEMEEGARVVGVGRKYQYLCADHYAEWKPSIVG